MNRTQRTIERATGIFFGTYRWRSGPAFLLTLGTSSKSDCFFEIGIGRHFFFAATGMEQTPGERVDAVFQRAEYARPAKA